MKEIFASVFFFAAIFSALWFGIAAGFGETRHAIITGGIGIACTSVAIILMNSM